MGWSLVAAGKAVAASAPTTAALNTTGANLIVCVVEQYNGATKGTVTDSKGNTWTQLTGAGTSIAYVDIWYCASPTVGTSHTFTYSSGSNLFGGIFVQAWSGAATSPFDQQNALANSTSINTVQAGSITPTVNGELIVAGLCKTDNTTTSSINSGFTVSNEAPWASGVNEGGSDAYLVQTTAAAINPTWTVGGTVSFNLAAAIASFKVSTGGGTSVSLTGNSATSAKGSVSPSTSVGLSGLSSTVSQGTLSPSSGTSVALSGLSATVSEGTLAPSAIVVLTGHETQALLSAMSTSGPVQSTGVRAGGGRKRHGRYALTYKGETLLFESQEAIYAWFLKIDEAEVKEVKKKRYAMQSEFSALAESPSFSPSFQLPQGMPRSRTRSSRSRSMSESNTAKLFYQH